MWVGVNGSTPSSSRDWNGRVVLEKGSSGIEEGHLSDRRVFIEESSSLRQEAPVTEMEGLSLKKVRAVSKRGRSIGRRGWLDDTSNSAFVSPTQSSLQSTHARHSGIHSQKDDPANASIASPNVGLLSLSFC